MGKLAQIGQKFDLLPLTTCKQEFSQIWQILQFEPLNLFKIIPNLKKSNEAFSPCWPLAEAERGEVGSSIQIFFQNFCFVTFFTFRLIYFVQNFRTNRWAFCKINGSRTDVRTNRQRLFNGTFSNFLKSPKK